MTGRCEECAEPVSNHQAVCDECAPPTGGELLRRLRAKALAQTAEAVSEVAGDAPAIEAISEHGRRLLALCADDVLATEPLK